MVFRAPDGRYMIVTSDAMEGDEGKYRVGFSETSEYDGEHIKVAGRSVTLADIKQGLAGLADGSLVIGENRLEPAQTRENAPASGEGVVNGQVMAEGANEAQREENGGVSANEGSVRKALEKEYQQRLAAWDGKTIGFSFVVGDTSSVLRDIKINGKAIGLKQVRLDASKIKKILADHPEITIDIIKQFDKIINEPIIILDSKTVPGRLVLMGDVYANNGFPVRLIIEPNPKTSGGKVYANISKIASAIGKGTLQQFINTSKIRYINESRINDWLKVNRLQLPLPNAQSDPATNSIPQNSEKSTDSGEKVAENIEAVDGSRRSALPRTRARGDKTKTQAKAERKAAERIAEEMRGENGRGAEDVAPYEGNAERAMPSRGYTDAEANTARGLVKDFDLMPPSVRRSVVELIRSGEKSGASKNFLRHSANLIAYWRRGLWIIADDKTRDDGFYTTFTDGSRLIVVKPNREAKAVSDTLMHELAHDVWARADAATRKVLYELATKGVKQEEIDAIRERYRKELTNRGEIPEKAGEQSKVATTESESNGRSPHPSPAGATFPAGEGKEMTEAEVEELLEEEVATNLIGEIIGKEEFLGRFDGSETSTIKRILRTLSNMKKRFTGKDKYLFRKADDLFKAFTKVMALEEVGAIDVGERTRRDLANQKDFQQQLDDWWNGQGKANGTYNGQYFRLGTTPKVLQKHGAPNAEIIMSEDCLIKIMGGKHSIALDEIAKVPEQLNDPVLLFEGSVPNSFVALTEAVDKHGHEVVVAIHIRKWQDRTLVNKITSMYSKTDDRGVNHIIEYVNRQIDQGKLKDASTKKAPIWFTSRGLQLPKLVQTIIDANNSIAEKTKKSTDSGEKVSEISGAKQSALPKRGQAESETTRRKLSSKGYFFEDKYFGRQIDKFETLKQGGYITVGDVAEGSPLNKVGIPAGRLYFDVSKIVKEMKERLDVIPADVMKEIPKVLDNPIVITEFVDRSGMHSVNVYGNLYIGGSPVVVGVMVVKSQKGSIVSKIQTVHPNRNAIKEMADDNILYLTENKREAKQWFQSLGTQKLPLGGNKFGFIRSISQNSEKSTDSSKKVLEKSGTNRSALPKAVKNLSNMALSEEDQKRVDRYNKALTKYKAEKAELREIRAELKELQAKKKERKLTEEEKDRITILKARQQKLRERLKMAENQLLKMEALKPIQRIVERERAAAKREGLAEGEKKGGNFGKTC